MESNKKIFFRADKEIESVKERGNVTLEELECYKAWKLFDTTYRFSDYAPDIEWDIDFKRPEPPEFKEIIGYGLPRTERKFPYYSEKYKRSMEVKMDEANPKHNEFLSFIEQEWDRRRNGLFFYNGDKLEYVTGRLYMFLQYWLIPIIKKNGKSGRGNPQFRENLLMVAYASDIVRRDPTCIGLLYYSFRRGGKTVWGISDGYWDATEHEESILAIQSKTEADAKKVFKKLVDSWSKLPAYWKPLHSGETVVKRNLLFEGRKKVTKEGEIAEYSMALKSEIYYAASSEATLDGARVTYLLCDEIGKALPPLDVNERHNINRECLVQGNVKLGITYTTSTIEDMEKYASKEAEILWYRSNPNKRLPDGFTDSGMYGLFIPAYVGLQGKNKDGVPFVDEWGYTDLKVAKRYILDMYSSKKGKDLMSFRRKYPMSISDSFAVVGNSNNYSKERLMANMKYNGDVEPSPWVRGNFVWEGGVKDSTVVWQPDVDGRWVQCFLPEPEDRCKFEMRGNQRFPTRSFAKTGADPFAHSHVQGVGSNAAATTIIKGYARNRAVDHGVVCHYLHRTEYTEQQFEDILMQTLFYSGEILPENNVYAIVDWFRMRGYDGFVMKNPLEKDVKKRALPKKGISTTGKETREDIMSMTQAYIYDYIGFIKDMDRYGIAPDVLLQDWLDFNPAKWTDYDSCVSSGLAIVAMYAKAPSYNYTPEYVPEDWGY